jgi:glutathione S-transferase
MLKVYGHAMSRAVRTMWMCEELGIPYELVGADALGGLKSPQFLKLNPNGHIPVIDEDGFVLYESMAINLYLAAKHQRLWPSKPDEQALCVQWSFWGMMETEGFALQALQHRLLLPAERREEAKALAALESLRKPFQVIDDHLRGRTALVGGEFSVADLNASAILSWARVAKADLAPYPSLDAWLGACLGRPAFKTARGRK